MLTRIVSQCCGACKAKILFTEALSEYGERFEVFEEK